MARQLPPLPDPKVPMFGPDGTMSPTWRVFWQGLLLYVSCVDLQQSPSYPNDAAAAAGGVRIGEEYRNNNVRQVRIV
jgi:hypothetical protein